MSDVRFTDDEGNYVLIDGRCVGWFFSTREAFYFYCQDEAQFTSAELRAIADKLDELNTQSQTAKE